MHVVEDRDLACSARRRLAEDRDLAMPSMQVPTTALVDRDSAAATVLARVNMGFEREKAVAAAAAADGNLERALHFLFGFTSKSVSPTRARPKHSPGPTATTAE